MLCLVSLASPFLPTTGRLTAMGDGGTLENAFRLIISTAHEKKYKAHFDCSTATSPRHPRWKFVLCRFAIISLDPLFVVQQEDGHSGMDTANEVGIQIITNILVQILFVWLNFFFIFYYLCPHSVNYASHTSKIPQNTPVECKNEKTVSAFSIESVFFLSWMGARLGNSPSNCLPNYRKA